ncbi:hypothetical protein EW145_g2307 [Phellinidium pouzarii]|uniref:Uncharacterized protein n=1 Tax=Phellinidium pouzarii TaxID=167371 RepID=A0A4S4LBU2_9AGAM|nr:hypothetical protein EW145_g2307 [Phellinidium pouzarii]
MVRFKNRWLLIEFIPLTVDGNATYLPSEGLNGKYIWSALKESVLANFGDTGWGAVGTSLTVRVARDHHRIAWGAVTLLKKVQGKTYIPNVIHVSGTIKHAQLAAIAHNREAVAKLRALSNLPAMYQSKYDDYLETSMKEIDELQD